MKTIIMLMILFAFIFNINAQNSNDFSTYLNYFSKTELPINTRDFMKFKRDDSKNIPPNLVLKYLYKNDTSKQRYYLELVSDISQKVTFSGYVDYTIWAANYFFFKNLILVTYERSKQYEGESYYLASYTQKGELRDSLLVLSSNIEGEWVDWVCSKILYDRVIVFHYLGDYNNRKITEIIISTYYIEEKTGKFIIKDQKVVESKYSINDFNGGVEKCFKEDPFNNY